jgi:ABC-type hemin transport system substrate-binding protein
MFRARVAWLMGQLVASPLVACTVLTLLVAAGLGGVWGCERRGAVNAAAAEGGVRVVALAPGFAQMLRASGAGDLLVGRHAYDAWSETSIAVCGDQSGVDYERLVALRPTHVLFQRDATATPQRLVAMAQARGWKLIELPLLTLADVERAGERVAGLVREAGREGGEPWRKLAGLKPPAGGTFHGRVLLLHGVDPPTALGPGSAHHELLLRVGGVAALTEGKPFATLDAEWITALDPAGIVLIRPRRAGAGARGGGDGIAGGGVEVLGSIGHLPIEAVRAGRVAVIDDEMALVHGLNLAEVGAELDAILRRWASEGR